MEKLKVKTIKLQADGVLLIETNIKDNLELAKLVDKEKMEHVLNEHSDEFHLYIRLNAINTFRYRGKLVTFTLKEFNEFLSNTTYHETDI